MRKLSKTGRIVAKNLSALRAAHKVRDTALYLKAMDSVGFRESAGIQAVGQARVWLKQEVSRMTSEINQTVKISKP